MPRPPAELIKDVERIFNGGLHRWRIVTHSFGAQRRREKLVCSAPFGGVSIAKEDTCFLVLDGVQWVSLVDLFREKVRLGEHNCAKLGVVGVVDCTAHVGGLEDGTILIEESLVIAQVVWVDLEKVSNEGEAFGAGDLADGLAFYRDGNWACGGEDPRDAGEICV